MFETITVDSTDLEVNCLGPADRGWFRYEVRDGDVTWRIDITRCGTVGFTTAWKDGEMVERSEPPWMDSLASVLARDL
jgi:hypothetical protein